MAAAAALVFLRGSAERAFDAGTRFARGRSADACLEEIRRLSLEARPSLFGLSDPSFAEGCFGSAEGSVRRCASIPPATSPEGHAWRAETCGTIRRSTRDCHVQLGAVQRWCDRVQPVDPRAG